MVVRKALRSILSSIIKFLTCQTLPKKWEHTEYIEQRPACMENDVALLETINTTLQWSNNIPSVISQSELREGSSVHRSYLYLEVERLFPIDPSAQGKKQPSAVQKKK